MIGFVRGRLEDLEHVLDYGYELRMVTKHARVQTPHSIESRCRIIEIEPAFVAPSELHEESIDHASVKMALGEGYEFASPSQTPSLGGVPSQLRQTAPNGIR
jgi:hypothetical protein